MFHGGNHSDGLFFFQDCMVDGFGAFGQMIAHDRGFYQALRVILDQDSALDNIPIAVPDGNGWIGFQDGILLESCSFLNRQISGGADQLLTVTNGFASLQSCYFENSEDCIQIRHPVRSLGVRGCVFRSVGRNTGAGFGSLHLSGPFSMDMVDLVGFLGIGIDNEFREGKAGVPSIFFERGATTRNIFQRPLFKNNLDACVRIGPQGNLNLSANGATDGYKDGGGNSDVGIDIVGPGAIVSLNTGTNVTGTAGDVRLGGVVQTYASIPSTGSGHANSASAVRRA
jgi:hypothetical protein